MNQGTGNSGEIVLQKNAKESRQAFKSLVKSYKKDIMTTSSGAG